MRIFDMHTHMGIKCGKPDVLAEMEKAGVYGGCIFSPRPKEHSKEFGVEFEERLAAVLDFTKDHRDRLFPILWVDPYEKNIFENIDKAVEAGVDGFKMICSTYFVYEEQSLAVLKHIASLGKPVFFHSGILWDGKVSSAYNRPMNWEALLPIKGLRFSMGHCSWPWIDECIAMYGKFLNADNKGTREHAEMFLDLTPGTPDIYREELLTKLFTIGYDFENNVFFGTDCYSQHYNPDWTKHWLETDRKIMDKLGVSKTVREKIYFDNLLRFLGKSEAVIEHARPSEDNSNAWSPVNGAVYEIIEKWYSQLNFPKVYDAAFKKALTDIKISDAITIENYDVDETDGKRNFLSYLFFCEALKEKYAEKGIDEKILTDTLSDLVVWLDTWSDLKGELYLGELAWLRHHLSMQLFRLGRLQFCMAGAEHDIPSANVKKGDPVIEVHIPEDGKLDRASCEESLKQAREFFKTYFPEYDYKCFTCHSWLLDASLKDILGEESNISKFREMFTLDFAEESDAIFKYVFRWNATRNQILKMPCASGFASRVQKKAREGGKFYETVGWIQK